MSLKNVLSKSGHRVMKSGDYVEVIDYILLEMLNLPIPSFSKINSEWEDKYWIRTPRGDMLMTKSQLKKVTEAEYFSYTMVIDVINS